MEKPDAGHTETDKLLDEIEEKVKAIYSKAAKEAKEKLDDYLRRFEIKDKIWQRRVASGDATEAEYKQWRKGQIIVGKRWEAMVDTLSKDYHNANVIARSIIDGYRPEAYAINFNFATYDIEKQAKIDTGFTLYDAQTIERIIRDNPDLLPPPGPQMRRTFEEWDEFLKSGEAPEEKKEAFEALKARNKDLRWQAGQIQSVATQSILQGESIPQIAQRIADEMGEINHKASIRYARTAMTGAQNAGRIDGFKRARDMGIKLKQEWRAVLDMRTRHEHRLLDGQVREVDTPFEVEGYKLRFPGDPAAPGHLIWNCRCTLRSLVDGFEPQARKYRNLDAIEGMTYEQWKESRVEKPHKITKQEEIERIMRRRYINELYRGR